jgi:hypothetical protein
MGAYHASRGSCGQVVQPVTVVRNVTVAWVQPGKMLMSEKVTSVVAVAVPPSSTKDGMFTIANENDVLPMPPLSVTTSGTAAGKLLSGGKVWLKAVGERSVNSVSGGSQYQTRGASYGGKPYATRGSVVQSFIVSPKTLPESLGRRSHLP